MNSIRIDILDTKAMQFLKGLQELKLIRLSDEPVSNSSTDAKKQSVASSRQPGLAKGLVIIKDNFDDPIQGFDSPME